MQPGEAMNWFISELIEAKVIADAEYMKEWMVMKTPSGNAAENPTTDSHCMLFRWTKIFRDIKLKIANQFVLNCFVPNIHLLKSSFVPYISYMDELAHHVLECYE
jgi:hypothetical protein